MLYKKCLTDEEIEKYIDEYYCESMIIALETQILYIMKERQKNNPSEKNNREWLEFSDYYIARRARSNAS